MSVATIDSINTSVEADIARHIRRRTARRVSRLGVDRDGERIVVSGIVPSYYVKQLVIRALQEIQASDTWSGTLDLSVEVTNTERKEISTPAIGGWEEQLDEANHTELCAFVGQGYFGPFFRGLVARWLPTR